LKTRTLIFPILVLSLAILSCQVLSTAEPTPLPTYTLQPTYTPYPTLTPEPRTPGGFPFTLTLKTFAETDPIEEACATALGPDWRLADWLDIQDFYEEHGSMDDFIASMGDKTSFLLASDGERWYSEQRHYYAEIHLGELPDGWLSHDDLEDHTIDLGSWYGLDTPILCFLGEDRIQAPDEAERQAEDAGAANTTPETPPTFEVRFHGTQPCGEWPSYAVFELESTSIWILHSSHIEIHDNTNNQAVYSGNNDRPFLKDGECPPGDTILPPFNTRYVAVNIKSPEADTEFSAAITLCTEEGIQGECATEIVDFVFEGESLPFAGTWVNEATGMVLEFSATSLVKRFTFEGSTREIYYAIQAYDVEEGHLDLLTERVLQGGEEVEYDWALEQYLSYTVTDDVLKMFIGPNPYPIAAAGVNYTRQAGEAHSTVDGNSFLGIWENPTTGAVLEFSEDVFLNKFAYKNGIREIFYDILAYDFNEGHLDLLTNRVLQSGEEVDFDWEPEQYLSYTITDDVMKIFIGPNPYPNAAAGVSYHRQEKVNENQADGPSESVENLSEHPRFDLEFAGTHPCASWPSYAAFWVKNTSQHTFESESMTIKDITNEVVVYRGSNDRGFVKEGGCPPGESALLPGERMQVAANVRDPEPDAEFEATIRLCTEDGLEGECVFRKVTFAIKE